jgi:hypothetical protein
MISETTKHRIIKYLNYRKISVTSFLKTTGIKRGFLDSDKLEATVSDVFLTKIIANYNEINLTWLITGEGEMLKIPTETGTSAANSKENYIIELQKDKIISLEKELNILKKEVEDLKKEVSFFSIGKHLL